MAKIHHFIREDEIHPIDVAETVVSARDWSFDRIAQDQITTEVQGQWRTYSLTLAWSPRDHVLRLICTFDMDPPAKRLPAVYETLNLANDQVWDGNFTYWPGQKLMVWRYGLVLGHDAQAAPEQIDTIVNSAITACERFYPSFQLTAWGNAEPLAALDIAMGEAYGRA
ncbi:MAG: YbjN domain-containing protein [Paracoccus sp. (in: a-proteobacteria)]|uniref:YbjN domain-containing protein n=1 Tax=Paracoccus sp. TaxID=267 RepID=UPI0026E09E77|nr:YbjN domain-containing protein [Paracoccus sp. (in: a-proteobacteria)]MDO5613588.1 YbjN domain-containing protein [Paracoccus sp. (in: a-proteobacteria)]